MSSIDVSKLLRVSLLEGVSILLAGPSEAGAQDGGLAGSAEAGAREDSLGAAVAAACGRLGARVSDYRLPADASLERHDADAEVLERVLEQAGELQLLVVDAAGLFTAAEGASGAAGAGVTDVGGSALRACLEQSWTVTGAIANQAFLAAGHGGRIVYLAPSPGAGEHAEAARAGLENLARTLSVEWARHAVTAVTIAPGRDTPAGEVATLTAYLASPAGAYFSGCLLELGVV